jgi:hypothetical protein
MANLMGKRGNKGKFKGEGRKPSKKRRRKRRARRKKKGR